MWKWVRFLDQLHLEIEGKMSIIKELKLQFSSIAWYPFKEHVSLMAVASMKDYVPVEEETPKSLILYDWSLENVSNSTVIAETALPSGVCSLSWGCTAVPDVEGSQGLICVGMPSGCVELWVPCLGASNDWALKKVSCSVVR